jgi:hypothetical protein
MRNQFSGTCYRCGQWCAAGDGHFERFRRSFRVQHATCSIEHRGTPDPDRQADRLHRLHYRAKQTGRVGQNARRLLRMIEA